MDGNQDSIIESLENQGLCYWEQLEGVVGGKELTLPNKRNWKNKSKTSSTV